MTSSLKFLHDWCRDDMVRRCLGDENFLVKPYPEGEVILGCRVSDVEAFINDRFDSHRETEQLLELA
jgi:hypothetical protein